MSNKTHLRAMKTGDVPVVAAMIPDDETSWNAKAVIDSLSVHQCWVYECNDKIIGFIITSVVLDKAEILYIVVDSSEQGKGLGRVALSLLLNNLCRQMIKTVFLEVRRSHLVAQALYKSCQFVEAGCRRAYYPTKNGREDAIVFVRQMNKT